MSGYARAHRGRWDHPIFKNKQEAAVWAWMTDTARFRAHSFQTQFGMVHLARGQLLISERGVATDFGLHKNAVRRLLGSMVDAGMIELNRDHKASRAGTIATIVNYERYQSDSSEENQTRDQGRTIAGTKAGPRSDQGRTTREEREKREEREEESPSDSSAGWPAGRQLALIHSPPTLCDVGEVEGAFAAYQALRVELKPGARAIDLNDRRRRKLGARLVDVRDQGGWPAVLARIRGSPFLRGETSRDGKFVAEIDWLLEPANLTKVIEGNYDERRPSSAVRGPRVRGSPIDALSAAIAASGLGG